MKVVLILLLQVRSALEVKSRLYDQLNRGRTTDGDQRFLVNFDAKNGRGGSSSEDEGKDEKDNKHIYNFNHLNPIDTKGQNLLYHGQL